MQGVLGGLRPEIRQRLQGALAELNREQAAAVTRLLTAEDYALVLGMPGTGKTTLIAYLVRALVLLGKTVLLSAYTNASLDHVLLKLDQMGVGILRLGQVRQIRTARGIPRRIPDHHPPHPTTRSPRPALLPLPTHPPPPAHPLRIPCATPGAPPAHPLRTTCFPPAHPPP